MSCFTTEERISIVKLFYKFNGDYAEIADNWTNLHRKRARPGKVIIDHIIENFTKNGTVKFEIDAALNPVTGEMIPIHDKYASIYRIETLQHLNQPNPAKRVALAKFLLESQETGALKLDHIWFTSQATFYIHGYACRGIYRFWGSQRPEMSSVIPLDDVCLHVWTAICGKTVLGPYYVPQQFNADDYHDFLAHSILHEVHAREMDTMEYCWMQDVPEILKTEKIFYLICDRFGDQMIADKSSETINFGIDWPNYSPDLNPVDFFLWGYVKDKIHEARPADFRGLEEVIGSAFMDIRNDSEPLLKSLDMLNKRLELVKRSNGVYFTKTFF